MVLFKLGIFNIDYTLIILFFIGILIGLVLFGIIFLIIKLSTSKKRVYIVKSKNTKITEEEISVFTLRAVEEFNRINDEHNIPIFTICKDVSYNLVLEISRAFYPKSDMPVLELSIDEMLDMLNQISERIDYELDNYRLIDKDKGLSKKINTMAVSFVKKKTIGEIVTMVSKKEEDDAPFKKENQFTKFFKDRFDDIKNSILNKGLNTLNVLPKLSIVIIHIVGEECFKAFNKKLFNNAKVSLDEKNE